MFSETADTDVLRSVFLSQMLVYGQEKDAGEDEPGCEAHDAVYEKTFQELMTMVSSAATVYKLLTTCMTLTSTVHFKRTSTAVC